MQADTTPDALPADETPQQARERRRDCRQAFDAPATLSNPTPDIKLTADPYDNREVARVNLSGRGVGFVSDRPLQVGTYHRIRLPADARGAGPEVKVRYCKPAENGFVIGGELC